MFHSEELSCKGEFSPSIEQLTWPTIIPVHLRLFPRLQCFQKFPQSFKHFYCRLFYYVVNYMDMRHGFVDPSPDNSGHNRADLKERGCCAP